MSLLRFYAWVPLGIMMSSTLVMATELESGEPVPVSQEGQLAPDEPLEIIIRLDTEQEPAVSCFNEAPIEDSSAVMVCPVNHSDSAMSGGER